MTKYTLQQVAAAMAADSAKSRAARKSHRCKVNGCAARTGSAEAAANHIASGQRVPRDGTAYHTAVTVDAATERARRRALVSGVLTLDKLQRVMTDDEA